jgi:hypothetical protein
VRVVGGSSSLVVWVNCNTMRVAMSRAWLWPRSASATGVQRRSEVGRSIDQSRSEGSLGCSFSRQRQDETRTTPAPHGAPLPLAPCVSSFINLITSSLMETTNTTQTQTRIPKGQALPQTRSRKVRSTRSLKNIYTRITTTTSTRVLRLVANDRVFLLSERPSCILIRHSQRAYSIRPSVVTHPAVIIVLSSSHPRPRPKNHTSYFLVSPQGPPSIRNHIRLVSR